jgi:predicted NodU family carbamoyl transferase
VKRNKKYEKHEKYEKYTKYTKYSYFIYKHRERTTKITQKVVHVDSSQEK